MAHIQLRQVCKSYGTGLAPAIDRVDLEIASGEFCVFVGPSGCGKSTLLRMVAGLEAISSGELQIDGQRMNEAAPARRGVAMVFQSYALYPHMTIYQNMAFGLQVNGVSPGEVDRKVREAAATLQLTSLLERKPKALSGGQRQRAAIGRAIVKQPRVFLFDEPLSNLDAALRAQTRLEIARLHRQVGGASMIYVTHDQVEAMTLAQKIVLLNAGERIAQHGSVAQVGTPMDLYHRPNSVFAAEFVGSPRINLLPAVLLRAEAGHAVLSLAGREVAAAVDAKHLAAGSPVQLGVRPEHLQLVPSPGAAPLTGQVMHLERLGDSSLLYLEGVDGLPGAVLCLRIEGHGEQQAGQALTVWLAAESLHLFDSDGVACTRTARLPH